MATTDKAARTAASTITDLVFTVFPQKHQCRHRFAGAAGAVLSASYPHAAPLFPECQTPPVWSAFDWDPTVAGGGKARHERVWPS